MSDTDNTEQDQTTDQTEQDVSQTDVQEPDATHTEDTDLDTEQDQEQEPTEDDLDNSPDPRVKKARKEAAKYRERAQRAEAERDSTLELMANVSRGAVDLMLDAYGVAPDFIWSGGFTPLDFFSADGVFHREKVVNAIMAQEQKLGVRACSTYTSNNGVYVPIPPHKREGSPGHPGTPDGGGSWSDALRG